MIRRIDPTLLFLLFLSDVGLALLSLYLATQARIQIDVGATGTAQGFQLPVAVYVLVAVIWGIVLPVLGGYDPSRTRSLSRELRTLAVAVVGSLFVLSGILYFSLREVSRLQVLYFGGIDLGLTLGLRAILRLSLRLRTGRRTDRQTVLIVGAGRLGRELARGLQEHSSTGLHLVGFVDDDPQKAGDPSGGPPLLGGLADTERLVEELGVEEVVFALPLRAHRQLVGLVTELERLPVRVRVVPDFVDLAFFRMTVEDFSGMPIVGLREPAIEGLQRVVKRVFDLVVGTVLVVLMGPIMALVALAIRLDSPGPVIFRQKRVGENLRAFGMYKFRSMVPDAEARQLAAARREDNGEIVQKHPEDPRVTRVGRILRRYSLDELPQLFNVLKGDMSLVGPRPEMPRLVDKYEPWQRKRFAVPQGITGWWQINGRGDRPMHLHTEDDLWYIQNWSPLLDLKILWRTIGAVLSQRGAF